jgi:hypothetical protein
MTKIKKKVISRPEYIVKNTGKITAEPYEDICEYFYNKGYILGLQKAKGLDENKIDTLIKVYEVKTKYFDNLLEVTNDMENN